MSDELIDTMTKDYRDTMNWNESDKSEEYFTGLDNIHEYNLDNYEKEER